MPTSRRPRVAAALLVSISIFAAPSVFAGEAPAKPRARALGIPFPGAPGPANAITDVPGVTVGQVTLVRGEGPRRIGEGPVRTGVTAILPRGRETVATPVFAGWAPLNGNGELTGMAWVEEGGLLGGPILLTNTGSVGVVRDAAISWLVARGAPEEALWGWSLPAVGETWDGYLNDVYGGHVKEADVHRALDLAFAAPAPDGGAAPVAEGNAGGGTGMITFGWKGGTGTASRRVKAGEGAYTLGVLVQSNFGGHRQLRIAGLPVGLELGGRDPYWEVFAPPADSADAGSILVVVATDAPLLPHQLKRLARRAGLGLARLGGTGGNASGDLFLAFTTADPGAASQADSASGPVTVAMLPNDLLDPLFAATVEATEEAVVNALVAAEPMTGIDGRQVEALPVERVREILKRHGVLVESPTALGPSAPTGAHKAGVQ